MTGEAEECRQRLKWVERIARGTSHATVRLDVPASDRSELPKAPTGEEYDGMFLIYDKDAKLNTSRVLFHLADGGICGGWGGCAEISDGGAYTAVAFSDYSVADDARRFQNLELNASHEKNASRTPKHLRDLARRCDSFLKLVERGLLSDVPPHLMP